MWMISQEPGAAWDSLSPPVSLVTVINGPHLYDQSSNQLENVKKNNIFSKYLKL